MSATVFGYWPPRPVVEALEQAGWSWEIWPSVVASGYRAGIMYSPNVSHGGFGATPAQAMADALVHAGIAKDFWPEAEQLVEEAES